MLGQHVYSNKLNNVSQTVHEVDLRNQSGWFELGNDFEKAGIFQKGLQ